MDIQTKPRGCTSFKVRQLMRRLSQHYDAEVSRSGLKTTQYSLLSHLARLGPSRPVDLAGELKMTPSTLSRNLQPLIAAGWLSMEPGDDARSRRVLATDAGRDKRHEAQRRWRVAQENLNSMLGPRRVVALHALLDECSELLNPAPPGEDDE